VPTASERIRELRTIADARAEAYRLEAYRELCDRAGVELDENYSGAEDAGLIIDGDEPCHRYAAVTGAGEYVYALTYETLEAAQSASGEYLDDDLYAESPRFIIDLDSGAEWRPVISWGRSV
jgi:hypothetical protein